jgi:hypothetical protein
MEPSRKKELMRMQLVANTNNEGLILSNKGKQREKERAYAAANSTRGVRILAMHAALPGKNGA